MTRINLRLGQDLKDRVDAAARRAGMSVNAWLVRAAAAALAAGPPSPSPTRSLCTRRRPLPRMGALAPVEAPSRPGPDSPIAVEDTT